MTVTRSGEVLAHDKLDLAKSRARSKFIDGLLLKCPGLSREQIENKLLEQAARPAGDTVSRPAPVARAIESGRVVRPELFHTATVSGLTVPVLELVDGELIGRWLSYLRWHADGLDRLPRRKRRAAENPRKKPARKKNKKSEHADPPQ